MDLSTWAVDDPKGDLAQGEDSNDSAKGPPARQVARAPTRAVVRQHISHRLVIRGGGDGWADLGEGGQAQVASCLLQLSEEPGECGNGLGVVAAPSSAGHHSTAVPTSRAGASCLVQAGSTARKAVGRSAWRLRQRRRELVQFVPDLAGLVGRPAPRQVQVAIAAVVAQLVASRELQSNQRRVARSVLADAAEDCRYSGRYQQGQHAGSRRRRRFVVEG